MSWSFAVIGSMISGATSVTSPQLRQTRWTWSGVSVSGNDTVVVLDYRTAERLRTLRVGDHPQRVRAGYVDRDIVRAWRS